MDRKAADLPGAPLLLRNTADAKWKLLEAILGFRERIENNTQFKAEIIFLGEDLDPGLRALAHSLAVNYGISIHHAQLLNGRGAGIRPAQVEDTTEFLPNGVARSVVSKPYVITAETKLVQEFFSDNPSATRRAFDQHGRLRWSARARRDFTYVRQFGRFTGDFRFWRERLSAADSVRLSTGEGRIQFRLHTRQDYLNFIAAIRELKDVSWAGHSASEGEDPNS